MSSTMRFTPAHPIGYDRVEVERNSHGAGVKIFDRPGLEDALTKISETIANQMDTRSYTDSGEYPREEWDLFLGFTTWGREESAETPLGGADYHNVSNTSPEDMADIFGTVSEYTEGFIVWMTEWDGHWPHSARIAAGQTEPIYELTATDGDVSGERVRFGVTGREEVDWSDSA